MHTGYNGYMAAILSLVRTGALGKSLNTGDLAPGGHCLHQEQEVGARSHQGVP